MTLSATTTPTVESTVSPKTSPSSITTVQSFVRPSSQSEWTTTAPYVFYTAPSTCKYARIVIPDKGRRSSQSYQQESFRLESSSSTNHWLAIAIVNDTNNTEDMILKNYWGNTSFELDLNCFAQTGSNQTNFNMAFPRGPFDVVCHWQNSGSHFQYSMIHADRFILNPGEKFVGLTGTSSGTPYIHANFQAWVYN
jgi:hypothetical protein